MEIREFLTVREVADKVRVWPETVRYWLQSGKLKGLKLPGGDWRIKPNDLEDMLQIPRSPIEYSTPEVDNREASNVFEN